MLKKLMIVVLLIIGCSFFIANLNLTSDDLTHIMGSFFNFNENSHSPTSSVIPEPETYGMIFFGLVLMGAIAYRRRRVI